MLYLPTSFALDSANKMIPIGWPSNYRSSLGLRGASGATPVSSIAEDSNEPTSPALPVAIYPPLLIPEYELPTGSATVLYEFVA